MNDYGIRIRRLHARDISELAFAGADDPGRRLADAIETVDDVFGRHRHSIMKHDAAAELESDRLVVGCHLPLLGKVWHEAVVIVAVDPQ